MTRGTISFVFTIIFGFFLGCLELTAQEKPNIIFILADDLGYGDLSSYGAEDIQTPNIDRLSNEGITFTRAYANSTVCSPSRASILTGNYPDMVGVPGVIRDMPNNTWGNFKDDIKTLPQALKELNYNTALIGKWHLGYESPDLPNDRGFDYFKGFVGDMMDDYYTHRRAGVNWMRENLDEIDIPGHATELFSEWTVDYLKEQSKSEEPFFLFLTYNAPHDPVQPPKEWLEKTQKKYPNEKFKRQKMIAFVEHFDFYVGEVLKAVKENDLDENTIIVFTSDNGGALNYGARNLPFSGGKGDLFEGGIRIPCIAKLPLLKTSQNSDDPIMLMDFYPTLIQLAGGKIDENLPSQVISEMSTTNVSEGRFMVWMRREGHKFGGRVYYAISDGEFKLLQKGPFSPYEMYNLKEDPKELSPVDNPDKLKELKSALTKHIQKSGGVRWQ